METLLLVALAGTALLILAVRSRSALPAPLRGAELHLNETTLHISDPVRLSGRPDQVWRSRDGTLVITDTKTRKSHRIYPADTVQLSVYAYLLRRKELARVHDTAYVRVPASLGAKYVPVPLLPDAEIENLHARHAALIRGDSVPETNGTKQLCHHCGHKPRCPRWNG